MKLSCDVVDLVYPLLSGLTVKRYKDAKPPKTVQGGTTLYDDAEYITINSLPLIGGRIQTGYLNVNCHAKDLAVGVPNRARINAIATQVLNTLEKVSTTAIFIDFDDKAKSELIPESKTGEHYMNLRFSIRLLN